MAALTDNIGVLFRIKADTADAVRGIRETKQEVGGLEKAAAGAGSGFASMANPAALAAVAITAIATAAVTATKYLWDLTNAASEFGSKIYDAQLRTGLSAAALTTLSLAADQSGSSLEQVSGAVSKFNVLLGESKQGNEKALDVLKQYNITAKDSTKAFEQAVIAIASMTDADEKAAAAKALFKDRTAAILPVIDALGGDLRKATEEAERLGTTLTEEDIKAADAFGDSLDTLSTQVKFLGYKFALEFMPQITSSIRQIIQWLAANKDEIRVWGKMFSETISGIKTYFGGLLTGVNAAINGINRAFGLSASSAITWSTVMQGALGPIVYLFRQLARFGDSIPGQIKDSTDDAINIVKPPSLPKMPEFLNARGGNSPGSNSNAAQEEADRIAERNLRARIQIAENLLQRFQKDFSDAVTTGIENITGTDDDSILALKSAFGEYLEQIQRAMTALHRLQDQERATMTDAEKDLLTQKQRIEKEQVRLAVKKEMLRIDKAAADFNEEEGKKAQERIDAELRALEEKLRLLEKEDALRKSIATPPDGQPAAPEGPYGFDIGGSFKEFIDLVYSQGPTINQTLQTMGDIATSAFGAIAKGIGSMVEAWVLMGTAGPNAMRKMVASVLAGVAAQAAVLAIFELAKGFAALWLNPGEAATHFKSAALFGAIAVGAAVGGRAVAGDAFKTQTGAATGGGSGGNGNSPGETRYTTQFNGYGQGRDNILVRTLDRVNTTLGMVEETQHQFNQKVLGMSPTDVVVLGANGASREIRGAVVSDLSADVAATDGFMRNLGFAR